MFNLKKSGRIAVLLGACALAGCGGGYYRAGVVIGPPPPPPVYGAVGYAPGPGYVWTDGFYDLRGGRWVWVNGHWARPPYRGGRWVRPYWDRHGRGYRFHRGYWRR
jgi:hypothetical protein